MNLSRIARGAARLVRHSWTFRALPGFRSVLFVGRCRLFVRLSDARGRLVLRTAGATQPNVTSTWKALVESWQPELAVDVGANYGEIGLSTTYPRKGRLVLVEANPTLIPYLRSSRETHRDRDRIELFNVVAGSETAEILFHYSDHESGGSYAGERSSTATTDFRPLTRELKEVPLDTLLRPFVKTGVSRILVKLDVEGYELKVLKGMSQTLSECPGRVIIVEFNPTILPVAKKGGDDFFNELLSWGTVFEIRDNGELHHLTRMSDRQQFVKCDLLVASPAALEACENRLPIH